MFRAKGLVVVSGELADGLPDVRPSTYITIQYSYRKTKYDVDHHLH
jgi:hypothetical protein